jgi:hypothetical protein
MRQYARGEAKDRSEPSLLPLQDMRRAILGSVLADKLPAEEEKLAEIMKDGHENLAPRLISDGVRGAEKTIGDYLEAALKNSVALTKSLMGREQ